MAWFAPGKRKEQMGLPSRCLSVRGSSVVIHFVAAGRTVDKLQLQMCDPEPPPPRSSQSDCRGAFSKGSVLTLSSLSSLDSGTKKGSSEVIDSESVDHLKAVAGGPALCRLGTTPFYNTGYKLCLER